MAIRNIAAGVASPTATTSTCKGAVSGENGTFNIAQASHRALTADRLSCLTAEAIERLVGIDLPLSRELEDLDARALMGKLAPAGGWRGR